MRKFQLKFTRTVMGPFQKKNIMAEIMRIRKFLMLITFVSVKIQLNLQERSWDSF